MFIGAVMHQSPRVATEIGRRSSIPASEGTVEQTLNSHTLEVAVVTARGWIESQLAVPGTLLQAVIIAASCAVAVVIAPKLRSHMRSRLVAGLVARRAGVEPDARLGGTFGTVGESVSRAMAPLTIPLIVLAICAVALATCLLAGWPYALLRLAVELLALWVVIRLSAGIVRDRFWARVLAVVVWLLAALILSDGLGEAVGALERSSVTIGNFRISPLGVVAGLLWLALLVRVAGWTAQIVEIRVLSVSRLTPSVQLLLSRLLKVVLIIAAVFVALGTIGVDLTAFAVFTGAVGVGVGFGLQAIFNNFVAGLILLSERSLKVGDFVEVERGHLAGTVRQINIRNTIITTPDSIDVAVPNSEFVNGRVTNWTMLDANARIHVPFAVAYGTDEELVRRVVLAAADGVKFTLRDDHARLPQVWLVTFAESRLELELVVWLTVEGIHKPLGARAAYCWAIYAALREYGIAIPFPQRELHLRSSVPVRIDGDNRPPGAV